MKKWKSVAKWDSCLGFCDNTTTDTHHTKEEAESVCRLLRREGLGGNGTHFPLETKVEEIEELQDPIELAIDAVHKIMLADDRDMFGPR